MLPLRLRLVPSAFFSALPSPHFAGNLALADLQSVYNACGFGVLCSVSFVDCEYLSQHERFSRIDGVVKRCKQDGIHDGQVKRVVSSAPAGPDVVVCHSDESSGVDVGGWWVGNRGSGART